MLRESYRRKRRGNLLLTVSSAEEGVCLRRRTCRPRSRECRPMRKGMQGRSASKKEERSEEQLLLASVFPSREEKGFDHFRELLLKRLKRTGVKVITGEEAISSVLTSDSGRTDPGNRIEHRNVRHSGT